jgi:hypothetical protein
MQGRQCVGQERRVPSALDGESQRPVEPGQLIDAKSASLAFAQPYPSNRHSILDLILQRHRVPPQMNPPGQRLQLRAGGNIYQFGRIEHDAGMDKVFPACHPIELTPDSSAQGIGCQRRQLAA